MTAAAIIEEIKQLSAKEQAEVIQFTSELASKCRLSATQLGALGDRLADSADSAEITRLKSIMTLGFYGE